jgi:cation:H+ antiporter
MIIPVFMDLVYTFAGFILLIWGADRFSAGAGSVARLLGVSPVVIGLTVVAFATSAPEIMVSISAARDGLIGLAVGNALGSNIANIGLVLGLTAMLKPITHELSNTLRSELPVLLAVSFGSALLFLDGVLSLPDGALLLIALIGFLYWIGRTGKRLRPDDPVVAEAVQELPPPMSATKAVALLIVGFVTLLIGAELLVAGAENIARAVGVSDLIIGLTVVAIGTSLPELAVSMVSILRGEAGIAVGNIIGSNVFNLLAVIGVAGIIGPGPLETSVFSMHYPVMLVFTMALLRLTYNPFGKPGVGRLMGLMLLCGFIGYQAFLLSGKV